MKKEIVTASPEETLKVASDFIKKQRKGSVIALSGTLGAGKTTFAKGVASGLAVKEYVKSPTFNLLHIYKGKMPIYHFDFYRLEGDDDLEALGFVDYLFDSDGIALLEWPEKVKDQLPRDTKWVKLSYVSETERKIRFE